MAQEYFFWNQDKNKILKAERGICFEDIVLRINSGHILEIVDHPNNKKYPNQMIMILNVDDYVYMVPFVFQEEGIFLKNYYTK
jgi:uncharacterized DUF497 family protein